MDPLSAAIGLGLKIGPDILEKLALSLGGGDVKDMIGEQAGAYGKALMEKRDSTRYLPDDKMARFREKFPDAAEWLDLALERDESVSFLALFLLSVQKRFDNPKNNGVSK